MDFIEQLPPSLGFTTILVVVDRLSKQAIFIPTYDTITSMQLAQLFVLHVFSKHGVLSHVTSDCRTEFVLHFFRSLGKALNMKLHFTSGYHPEGDGPLYLIRWAGYKGTDQETDWLPTTELKHAIELVQDFHDSYPNKPGPLNSL